MERDQKKTYFYPFFVERMGARISNTQKLKVQTFIWACVHMCSINGNYLVAPVSENKNYRSGNTEYP